MTKIDIPQLLEQIDNDWKLLSEAFELLCQEIPRDLLAIEDALSDRDARRMAKIAHTMRGMLANFCAADACAAATAVESAARENDFSLGMQLVSRLKEETIQAQSALQQLIDTALPK